MVDIKTNVKLADNQYWDYKGILKMEHSRKEIIEALKIIKDVCIDNLECSTCPFAHIANGYVKCKLDEEPTNWNINDQKDEIWRALK